MRNASQLSKYYLFFIINTSTRITVEIKRPMPVLVLESGLFQNSRRTCHRKSCRILS